MPQQNGKGSLVTLLQSQNVKELLTKQNFAKLPVEAQQKILKLLPSIDVTEDSSHQLAFALDNALSNEFFNTACADFMQRIERGDITAHWFAKDKLQSNTKMKLDLPKQKAAAVCLIQETMDTMKPDVVTSSSPHASHLPSRTKQRSPAKRRSTPKRAIAATKLSDEYNNIAGSFNKLAVDANQSVSPSKRFADPAADAELPVECIAISSSPKKSPSKYQTPEAFWSQQCNGSLTLFERMALSTPPAQSLPVCRTEHELVPLSTSAAKRILSNSDSGSCLPPKIAKLPYENALEHYQQSFMSPVSSSLAPPEKPKIILAFKNINTSRVEVVNVVGSSATAQACRGAADPAQRGGSNVRQPTKAKSTGQWNNSVNPRRTSDGGAVAQSRVWPQPHALPLTTQPRFVSTPNLATHSAMQSRAFPPAAASWLSPQYSSPHSINGCNVRKRRSVPTTKSNKSNLDPNSFFDLTQIQPATKTDVVFVRPSANAHQHSIESTVNGVVKQQSALMNAANCGRKPPGPARSGCPFSNGSPVMNSGVMQHRGQQLQPSQRPQFPGQQPIRRFVGGAVYGAPGEQLIAPASTSQSAQLRDTAPPSVQSNSSSKQRALVKRPAVFDAGGQMPSATGAAGSRSRSKASDNRVASPPFCHGFGGLRVPNGLRTAICNGQARGSSHGSRNRIEAEFPGRFDGTSANNGNAASLPVFTANEPNMSVSSPECIHLD